MRHTNPHNPIPIKPKKLVHQSLGVERAPAETNSSSGLDGLDDGRRRPAGDAEAHGRDAGRRGGADRPVDGDVGARGQVGQQRRLQRLLVRDLGGPGGGRGEVGHGRRDAVQELVACAC